MNLLIVAEQNQTEISEEIQVGMERIKVRLNRFRDFDRPRNSRKLGRYRRLAKNN